MKKSLEEVANIVENEGLGYAVQYYMSGDAIEDVELAKLWDEASRLLGDITAKLEDYLD